MSSDVSIPPKSKLMFESVKYQFLASVCGNYQKNFFKYFCKNCKCYPLKYIEHSSDAFYITEMNATGSLI